MASPPVRPLLCVALVAAAGGTAFAAGDVVAVADATGALLLTGDDLANDLQVGRDPLTGEFVVLGRNGTTVGGAAEWRSADVRSIHAKLGGGDDVLDLGGIRLRGSLFADLGDGADTFGSVHVAVRRRTTVVGGPGDDVVSFEGGSDLRGGAAVTTGDGADVVRIADSIVRGRLRLLTGAGDDRIEIHRDGLTDRASLLVRTGDGADVVDLLGTTFQAGGRILTSSGADQVSMLTSRFRRDVSIDGGSDDDRIDVDRSTFDAELRVHGGSGTNRMFVVGVRLTSGSGGFTAGGSGSSDHFTWWFVIVHVFP